MRVARVIVVVLATLALSEAAASAQTVSLHYFARQVSVKLQDRGGHPVNARKSPAAGDVGDEFGIAYRGNHRQHAKRWTVSFHLRCAFRSAMRATCDGQIAIGGSMLLLTSVHLNFAASSQRLRISAGTGVFHSARGTLTTVNVGTTNNADFTIRVRT